jgi:hypothetical protein
VLEFYSGAAGLSGRFTEGFSLRRLHLSGPSHSNPEKTSAKKVGATSELEAPLQGVASTQQVVVQMPLNKSFSSSPFYT